MKKIIFLAVFCAIAWLLWSTWYNHALSAPDAKSTQRISVTIPSGSSSATIANTLEEKGLIRSSYAFLHYAKKVEKASLLQAGIFVLQPSMSTQEVVDILSTGKTQEQSVTIPEGYTVEDIDTLLAEKQFITKGDFVECARTCDFSSFDFLPDVKNAAARGGKLEGYLYPDTYFVDASTFKSKFFAERMLGVFRTKIVKGLQSDIASSGRSLHEIITMASLVEEEARTPTERAVVAGILWKRLDENIGLYVDASNRYILNKPTGAITAKELDMDSPYNLRKYRGLPPSPIANSSLQSIQATLRPASSPYYYYLHGLDGVIRYAVTNDEHNANKAKYLR